MVEFEPPKPQALSDAELHRAISLLGSSAEGLSKAEILIADQARLREQDSRNLSDWIATMQRLGSDQARAALQKILIDVLPPHIESTTPAEELKIQEADKAVFTTELNLIRRRSSSRRVEITRKIIPAFAGWLLVGLANTLVAHWLDLTLMESIISFGVGLLLASLVLIVLKTHSLHPLLRSAAVFGGWGVYPGAALAMALSSLVVLEGFEKVAPTDFGPALQYGFRTDVLVAAAAAVLLGQVLPRQLHFWSIFVVGFSVLLVGFSATPQTSSPNWFAYAPVSQEVFEPNVNLAYDPVQIIWGSLAVAFLAVVLFAFAMPHISTRAWSFSLQLPLGYGISVVGLFAGAIDFLALGTLTLIFLSISLSGRDLSTHGLGRLAGLAFLLPVLLSPVIELVSGAAVSVLVTLVILLLGDQIFRTTPLHIPSLDTSYGFYGSFQLLTWVAIVSAIPFGIEEFQDLLVPNSDFSRHELALVFGLVIGLTAALARIFVIRAQDREIRNVEFRNMNLDNLLGL